MAWTWYVQGHVVSDHACRTIKNLLSNTLAHTAPSDDSSEEEDEAGTRESDNIKPLCPSVDMLHKILHEQSGRVEENVGARRHRAQQEHARTIKRTRAMWSLEAADAGATGIVDTAGDRPTLRVAEYGKAARTLGKLHANEELMPFSGQTEPLVAIYDRGSAATVSEWLRDLRRETLEISLPFPIEACDLVCLEVAREGISQVCKISCVEQGFVKRWNTMHRQQRLVTLRISQNQEIKILFFL